MRVKSSYKPEDVEILLEDFTGKIQPLDTETREANIQHGTHYSEMLPMEYVPTEEYMRIYEQSLEQFGHLTAEAVGIVAEKIYSLKGSGVVLVSLARAGIPIGILIKHYLWTKYGINVPHYAISIIRGKGIDTAALDYILKEHAPDAIQFVDGWIGKGAIANQLKEALLPYPYVDSSLAVAADPAGGPGLPNLYGTTEDIMIPSSCLNATVSGLISRTIYSEKLIAEGDTGFHGAVYYPELEAHDLSYAFIEAIESKFMYDNEPDLFEVEKMDGLREIQVLQRDLQVSDINFIKPGIGETTRVLLRRVPWKVLISEWEKHNPQLKHIYQLAKEKDVEIEFYPLIRYKTVGIIKQLGDV